MIIHPGPVGDRGPSSLDWAITEGAPTWGVTALQAVEEMDAGPIWATRTFPMPAAAPRKSALYNGPVADAAHGVRLRGGGQGRRPGVPRRCPPTELTVEVPGARPRPAMRQADRAFDWTTPTEQIVRRIRAADGAPGRPHRGRPGWRSSRTTRTPGLARGARPGTLLSRRQGAVLVGTGDGSVWLGHLRDGRPDRGRDQAARHHAARRPAARRAALAAAARHRAGGAVATGRCGTGVPGAVGWLAFDFYNGAMSAGHCRRLLAALRHAAAQDTRVLVLRGGTDAFSNGIHLNVDRGGRRPGRRGLGEHPGDQRRCAGRSSPAPGRSSSPRTRAAPAPAA